MFGPARSLGVEIGERYLSIVELRRAGQGYEVQQAVRMSLPADATPRHIALALSQFLADTATPASDIACSLPAHLCAVKFAQLPRAQGAEQAKVIQYEAMSQIPLPLTEMAWDYQVSGSSATPMCQTVIAAVRRTQVQDVVNALAEETMRPARIGVSILAGARTITRSTAAADPFLLVQVGDDWSDIALVAEGRVVANRSIRTGMTDLTQAMAQDGALTEEEAANALLSHGFQAYGKTGATATQVIAWCERLGQQLRQSVETMSGEGNTLRPQQVVLVGNLAAVPGCAEALSRQCELPVKIGDPWQGMKVNDFTRHAATVPATFAAATGMALAHLSRERSINLLPRDHAEAVARKRKDLALVAGLAIAVLALLGISAPGGQALRSAQEQLREVKQKARAVHTEVRRHAPNTAVPVVDIRNIVQGVKGQERHPLDLLRRMSAELPHGISLTEFSYQGDKAVMLKGSALSNAMIADAVVTLNALNIFETIRLDFVSARKDAGEGYDFQLTCAFPTAKGNKEQRKQGQTLRAQ
ncbi:MAG: pilus assembly protein PilM [Armatimonadota bacterium]